MTLISDSAAMNLTIQESLVTVLVVKCYFCPPITNISETMARTVQCSNTP